jgi:hypothetical protein
MSDVARVREEMRHMLGSFDRHNAERWCERATDWIPRLDRDKAAKRAPKRKKRKPTEIMGDDERALEAVLRFRPAKTNVEIGNHIGIDPGRVSEAMRAARAHGGFTAGLAHLREIVRPRFEGRVREPYRRWQKAKKT